MSRINILSPFAFREKYLLRLFIQGGDINFIRIFAFLPQRDFTPLFPDLCESKRQNAFFILLNKVFLADILKNASKILIELAPEIRENDYASFDFCLLGINKHSPEPEKLVRYYENRILRLFSPDRNRPYSFYDAQPHQDIQIFQYIGDIHS